MSTLSKQSIISAATDSLQSASRSPRQLLPPFDSDTLSCASPSAASPPHAIPELATEDSLEALMSMDISSAAHQQKALQMLAEQAAIHSGEISIATAVITRAAAIILGADRVSLWLHGIDGQLDQIASYSAIEQTHTAGASLPAFRYAPYLETAGDRAGFSLDNIADALTKNSAAADTASEDSASGDIASEKTLSEKALSEEILSERSPFETAPSKTDSWIQLLVDQALIFDAPSAFLEMPVRCQGKVIGSLWCEHAQPHSWNHFEQAAALSISLLASTAIEARKQRRMAHSLASHSRQLKRETIEREQAEQAWQESQRFIQGIIDASTNILYVDSFADGSNFYISRWIENVLGYEIHEVQKLGPHYLEQLVHADQKQQLAAERKKLAAINDGEVVENEYKFRHRQGNWRWLLCRETVFQRDEDGQPTQVFGTATDITKRKHAEEALKEFNKELTRLARMDGLTQVANRRAFDQRLQQEWDNVGSGHASLSLILCDIDYFKNFNDTYGHQAGDVCLRQVAEAIERAVKRSTDLVARYGGEEFAIILPNTAVTGLTRVATEIQREIQSLAIPHSCSAVSDYITLSLGLAVISSTENSHPDMLVAAADQGLYQAKYEGRDRFCLSELETEAPLAEQPTTQPTA